MQIPAHHRTGWIIPYADRSLAEVYLRLRLTRAPSLVIMFAAHLALLHLSLSFTFTRYLDICTVGLDVAASEFKTKSSPSGPEAMYDLGACI